MRSSGCGAWCFLVLGMVGLVPETLLAQAPPRPRPAALSRAATLLKDGRYSEAEAAFTASLLDPSVSETAFRAEAHFGRAFAVQQGLLGAESRPPDRVREAVQDYLEAAELDSASQFGAAHNNAALLLRAAGDHASAVRYFRVAAETRHPARAYFFLNAGQEYEALERPDSAAWAYRRALEVTPAYPEAQQALLDLYLASSRGDSVLALARRLNTGASAALAQEATLTLLERREPAISAPLAESGLVLLVRAYAANNPGPRLVAAGHRPRLLRIAADRQEIRPGIAALVQTYEPPSGGRAFREPAEAGWWRASDVRRAAWSSLLRSLGDWYNRAGNGPVAESYYEAALGGPELSLMAPWADVEALLPLAVLYAHQTGSPDKTDRYLREVERFEEVLFSAKMRAYQADDVQRIRYLHMTLGALFAERGQWGPGVRGAIFQLEHMRQMTDRLARETRTEILDPPELLEKLVMGYMATGQRARAESLARVVRDRYSRQNRLEDAARVERVVRPASTG